MISHGALKLAQAVFGFLDEMLQSLAGLLIGGPGSEILESLHLGAELGSFGIHLGLTR
jgi:hypothetical protein